MIVPPQPASSWDTVLNATYISPVCYQKTFMLHKHGTIGQEDCLYINVYTPKLSGLLPVMVYIHGGGFTYGWTGTAEKPSYFMDEDVVIVTVSYRLGYLGFLSFEDDLLPGNYGLKDQVLALEWVKKEIKNFGGNSNLITAFGISAGGASSHYLCSLPKARALLKGCISQSGVGGNVWSLHAPGDARKLAIDLAKEYGCGNHQRSDLLSCLQALPIEAFISKMDIKLLTGYPAPVIEKTSGSAVITQWPPTSSDFPWISGTTSNEGLLITGYVKELATFVDKIIFYVGGDIILTNILHLGSNTLKDIYYITQRFFKWKDIFNLLNDYERFFTELLWVYPSLKELYWHSGPKYFYRFSYTGGPSLWEQVTNKSLNLPGACHGDDSAYFFDLSNYFQPKGWPGLKDIELSKGLIKMWVAFATYQDPSTDIIQWDQFGDEANYLDITNEGISMKKYSNYLDIIYFWSNINIPYH